MENNNVEQILKSKRKEFVIYSVILFITVMTPLFLSHTLWVKLLPFVAIVVYIIVIGRTASLNYLIYDECNPELYYYAYIGLNKREPELEQKQKVAELIGDFETAIELAYGRLNLCKNDKQRLSVILDIARISFDAGDFELTRKAYNDFNNLKINAKVKEKYNDVLKLYIYYIDGDYAGARKHFDVNFAKSKGKNVKNLVKYKMHYYDGLISLALGENDRAWENLNAVISNCPHLYIAKLSGELLSKNALFEKTNLVESVQKGMATMPQKKKTDYFKVIGFVLALVAIALSLLTVAEDTDTTANTLAGAISNYCVEEGRSDDVEVILNINASEKQIVSVFETDDCKLSVAYVRVNEDGLYECVITFVNNFVDPGGLDYMQISGMSKRINYCFVSGKANAPDGYECERVKDNVYFCYRFDDAKYHFLDSMGMMSSMEIDNDSEAE